jgi:hypothetical protein
MSTNFKCLYCDRYLSSRNAYSQHVKDCKERYTSTEESNDNISSIVSSINDMSFDSDDFSNIEELQSIREENQQPVSEISYQFESDSSYAGDISFGGISHLSNIPEELSNFEESLQNYTEKSDTNKIYSNMIPEEFENFDQILPESLQSNIEESEVEIKEFPNEAYADLMTLVIENNLNNKTGNAIIKFFNKHLDLSQSPLPKNIDAGRKFMDKMNISQFSHSKYRILVHNNQEYFISYRPIKNCIENLLSNSKISQHLIFKYEDIEVNIQYIKFHNILNIYKVLLTLLFILVSRRKIIWRTKFRKLVETCRGINSTFGIYFVNYSIFRCHYY